MSTPSYLSTSRHFIINIKKLWNTRNEESAPQSIENINKKFNDLINALYQNIVETQQYVENSDKIISSQKCSLKRISMLASQKDRDNDRHIEFITNKHIKEKEKMQMELFKLKKELEEIKKK